jgi:hypothetical protein
VDPAEILSGVDEGDRDNSIFRYACSLRSRNVPEEEAKILVLEAAKKCRPSFPADRALEKVRAAYQKYEAQTTPPSSAEILKRSGLLDLKLPCAVEKIEQCLRQLAIDAKSLDALGRGSVREAAMQHLTDLKVKAPAQLLAPVFAAPAPDTDKIEIIRDENWPDPVDIADWLDRTVIMLQRFLFLPEGAAETEALWILHAHALAAFDISPYLAILSPEKRCGKTANLELLGGMVPKPLAASNITPAATFRAIEKYTPTLLIDEADTFLHNSDELRGVLNSGHRRSSAFVIRCVGDDNEPVQFSTWCPKAIARIGDLPDTLGDRSIIINMARKSKADPVERFRLDRIREELRDLRRQAARGAADNLELLMKSDPVTPLELNDRAGDNWRPLLAIAEAAGPEWEQRARRALCSLTGMVDPDVVSDGIRLLTDIRTIFEIQRTDILETEHLLKCLNSLDESPWGEMRKDKGLNARGMADLLKPFRIKPKQLWVNGKKTRGYRLEDFQEVWSRYTPEAPPSDPVVTVGLNGINDLAHGSDPVGTPSPTGSEMTVSDREQTILPDLPDEKGVSGGGDTPEKLQDRINRLIQGVKDRQKQGEAGKESDL